MNNSPWAKFTTSVMPKISVNPDATSARIMPTTMPFTVWMRICSMGMACRNCWRTAMLDSQVFLDHRVVGSELRGQSVVPDHALFHDVGALARLKRQRDVLLHQKDCHPFPVQRADDF